MQPAALVLYVIHSVCLYVCPMCPYHSKLRSGRKIKFGTQLPITTVIDHAILTKMSLELRMLGHKICYK